MKNKTQTAPDKSFPSGEKKETLIQHSVQCLAPLDTHQHLCTAPTENQEENTEKEKQRGMDVPVKQENLT